jgi:hypothetical protein
MAQPKLDIVFFFSFWKPQQNWFRNWKQYTVFLIMANYKVLRLLRKNKLIFSISRHFILRMDWLPNHAGYSRRCIYVALYRQVLQYAAIGVHKMEGLIAEIFRYVE